MALNEWFTGGSSVIRPPRSGLTCANGRGPPSNACVRVRCTREPSSRASWPLHVARGSDDGLPADDGVRQRDLWEWFQEPRLCPNPDNTPRSLGADSSCFQSIDPSVCTRRRDQDQELGQHHRSEPSSPKSRQSNAILTTSVQIRSDPREHPRRPAKSPDASPSPQPGWSGNIEM